MLEFFLIYFDGVLFCNFFQQIKKFKKKKKKENLKIGWRSVAAGFPIKVRLVFKNLPFVGDETLLNFLFQTIQSNFVMEFFSVLTSFVSCIIY